MSLQDVGSGAAQVAGTQVMNAVLATPAGQAAVVATAAVVVTAAPFFLIGAIGAGILCLLNEGDD